MLMSALAEAPTPTVPQRPPGPAAVLHCTESWWGWGSLPSQPARPPPAPPAQPCPGSPSCSRCPWYFPSSQDGFCWLLLLPELRSLRTLLPQTSAGLLGYASHK